MEVIEVYLPFGYSTNVRVNGTQSTLSGSSFALEIKFSLKVDVAILTF